MTLPTPRPKALQSPLASIAGIDDAWLAAREGARRAAVADGVVSTNGAGGTEGGNGLPTERPVDVVPPEPPPEEPPIAPPYGEALLVGAEALEQNPRQVKRFSNAFRLQLQLVLRSSSEPFTDDQLKALARWVAIRLRWGELAHAMDEEPALLGALERSAVNSEGSTNPPADVAEEHLKWVDPSMFPDLPALQAILRAGESGERISHLPFDRFIRIARRRSATRRTGCLRSARGASGVSAVSCTTARASISTR